MVLLCEKVNGINKEKKQYFFPVVDDINAMKDKLGALHVNFSGRSFTVDIRKCMFLPSSPYRIFRFILVAIILMPFKTVELNQKLLFDKQFDSFFASNLFFLVH